MSENVSVLHPCPPQHIHSQAAHTRVSSPLGAFCRLTSAPLILLIQTPHSSSLFLWLHLVLELSLLPITHSTNRAPYSQDPPSSTVAKGISLCSWDCSSPGTWLCHSSRSPTRYSGFNSQSEMASSGVPGQHCIATYSTAGFLQSLPYFFSFVP